MGRGVRQTDGSDSFPCSEFDGVKFSWDRTDGPTLARDVVRHREPIWVNERNGRLRQLCIRGFGQVTSKSALQPTTREREPS